jgi:hypothetical protein
MMKRMVPVLSLSAFLVAPAALAQPVSPAPDQEIPVPAEPAVPVEVAPAPVAPAPVAPTPAATPRDNELAAQVTALEAKVTALEKADQAQKAALAGASQLKLSGYVQGRYEWHDGSTNGATAFSSSGAATATNQNRFLVRHAYLTAQYLGTYAEYFMQIDANTKDGLGFKDVYAALIEPWTPLKMRLSVGQFRYPFGYEAQQSDADREMPERAPIEKFFFDGERDRGVRLQGSYQFFNFALALVNGTVYDGTRNLAASKDPAPFGNADPNEFKDWVGRLGVDFGFLVGGLSGYFGKGLYIKPPVAATDTTAASGAVPDSRYKYRLGADLQGYVDVPGVGLLALKGEVIYGKDTARQYHGTPADPCNSSATWGFIATAVQNFARDFGAVVRVDLKDTLASSIADGCNEQGKADSDRVITTGGGLLYYMSPNLKLTVTYEHPAEQGKNQTNNDFAMGQLQARF